MTEIPDTPKLFWLVCHKKDPYVVFRDWNRDRKRGRDGRKKDDKWARDNRLIKLFSRTALLDPASHVKQFKTRHAAITARQALARGRYYYWGKEFVTVVKPENAFVIVRMLVVSQIEEEL